MKKAILLIYTGSPDSYRVWDVMKYLYSFLNNRRIISLPRFLRFLIVCMHAVLFSRKACKTLQGICKYSSGRFPLPFYCELLKNKLKTELDIEVYIGFGKPSVEDCVRDIVNRKVSRVDYICNELGVATATTCFHSQMSKRWFGTMTKPTLIEMIKQGKTRILVVSPSFVSDCIETEIEINIELKQFFWTTAAKNCNW